MLTIPVNDTGGSRGLAWESKPVSKLKLLAEAEAAEQLDRIAPDWPLHLYDGGIIDHILKVINNPRASRTEITRRYRARRSTSGLAAVSEFRSVPSQARRRR
jgi:hypothetical protein